MFRRAVFYSAFLVLLLNAAGATAVAQKAEAIYFGGPVFTMDSSNRVVEAVAVAEGKILAVGDKEKVMSTAGPETRAVDLAGRALLPGFIDGHSHFGSNGTYTLYKVNLNVPPLGPVNGIDALKAELKKKAAGAKPGEVIEGYNYNDLAMAEKRHPTRADLDDVSIENPIFIKHVSGHLAVVNSKLLQLAGITRETPDPQGGKIRKRADGEPDGVLEGPPAQALVTKLLPSLTDEQLLAAIAEDSRNYAASGITTAQNGGSPSMDELMIKAASEGSLKIRLVIWPPAAKPEVLKKYGDKRSGAMLDDKGMITLGAAKLFADGSPQGYTAYFSQPYYKQLEGKPADYRGFPVYPKDELEKRIKALHNDGWQIAIHTNGDQAIDDVIHAYIKANIEKPRQDARHVLVHAQFTRPDHVELIAQHGIIPSYFVTHTYFWGDIHRTMVAGPEKAAYISPAKASLDKGIPIVFHNDTPVTPISPIMDVFSAVNRLTLTGFMLGPEQRIDVMDALRAVTINAARMHFEEKTKGSLEPGKLADMVILSADPLKVSRETIKDLKVLETIVGGKTVHRL